MTRKRSSVTTYELSPSMRTVADILFWVYIAVLLRLTIFRHEISISDLFSGDVNLKIFTELIALIKRGGAYFFYRLLLGNIAAFVPLGAYLALRTNIKLWAATLAGTAVSLAIELTQFTFAMGVCEIDDIILNTAGTFIGAASAFLLVTIKNKKTKGTRS